MNSIRTKILVLLLAMLLLATGCYLVVARQLFSRDKTAYIYDQTSATAGLLASDLNSTIESKVSYAQLLLDIPTPDSLALPEDVLSFSIFDTSKESPTVTFDAFHEPTLQRFELEKDFYRSKLLGWSLPLEQLQHDPYVIVRAEVATSLPAMAIWIKSQKTSRIALLVLNLERHLSMVKTQPAFRSYVIEQGAELLTGEAKDWREDKKFFQDLVQRARSWKAKSGTFTVTDSQGEPRLLAFQILASGQLLYFADIRRDDALFSATLLLEKSAFFALLVLGISIVTAVLFTKRLTGHLSALLEATKKIAKGQFDIGLNVTGSDEVAVLATSFNTMAVEIDRLMGVTREQARMEKELETAQLVQDNFFPPENLEVVNLKFCAHFKPATECGGDWWGLLRVGKELIILIGDATGHGVPAALLTAAAHACLATLAHSLDKTSAAKLSPVLVQTYLNGVIRRAGKGKMHMSFFVGMVQVETGVLRYVSAGHPLPYRARTTPTGSWDLDALPGEPSEALGSKTTVALTEHTTKLNEGEALILYTDGLVESRNEKGEEWGEGRFLRLIRKQSGPLTARALRKSLVDAYSTHSKERPREDDITFVVMTFKEAVAAPKESVA